MNHWFSQRLKRWFVRLLLLRLQIKKGCKKWPVPYYNTKKQHFNMFIFSSVWHMITHSWTLNKPCVVISSDFMDFVLRALTGTVWVLQWLKLKHCPKHSSVTKVFFLHENLLPCKPKSWWTTCFCKHTVVELIGDLKIHKRQQSQVFV